MLVGNNVVLEGNALHKQHQITEGTGAGAGRGYTQVPGYVCICTDGKGTQMRAERQKGNAIPSLQNLHVDLTRA